MSPDAAKNTLKEMTDRALRAEKFMSDIANQRTLLLREEPTPEQIRIIKQHMRFESEQTAKKMWFAIRKAISETNPKVDDLV